MSDRLKKILFIVGFIVITVLLGYALYVLFLRQAPAPTAPPTNELPTGGLPTAGLQGEPTYINVNGQLVPAANVNGTPPSTIDSFARGGVTAVTEVSNTKIRAMQFGPDGKSLVGYDPTNGKFLRYNPDGTTTAMTDAAFPNARDI
ncbi:MAG: hypothetical protein AAB817_03030, partial [Patescibacteria group bacterium]